MAEVLEYQSVKLPKLFTSFLAEEPATSPHYETVKPISEEAVVNFCDLNPKQARMISKCDSTYLIAVVLPDAEISGFRVVCDWINWVFPFDDIFDNGSLRSSKRTGRLMMDSLMQPLLGQTPTAMEGSTERHKILAFHDTVWFRMQSASPGMFLEAESISDFLGTLNRFVQAMKDYTDGVVAHVKESSNHTRLDCEEMLDERRKSVGVTPLFALGEFALQLDLPDQVMQHPIIHQIRNLCIDYLVLHNDILSYRKEESEHVAHNMVASCRRSGMTAQQAFDHVGDMITGRDSKLMGLVGVVPSWGTRIDDQVQQYIGMMLNVVKANLYWSYASGRYFGKDGEDIKRSGEIMVQKYPSWLASTKRMPAVRTQSYESAIEVVVV